jgi:hypothetical protein
MKKRVLFLSLLALVFASGCGENAFEGQADKSSDEACRYETTINLDKGNYDAVLASSCAESMHKGAAYFGKAGYDIKDVVNRFSEAEDTANDLELYMTALTKTVTDNTLTNLDSAKTEYDTIPSTSENYKDAQFYVSLVGAVKSLSLIKVVIDADGDGALSSCDINSNTVPDEADSTSCALLSSGSPNPTSGNCTISGSTATYTASSDIRFDGKTGIYRGLTVTIPGTETATCSNTYTQLLYKGSDNNYWVATTSGSCEASDSNTWPCPLEQNNQPLDLVTAIDESITGAIDSIGTALPETITDVQTSINDIKAQNCCTDPGENPLNVDTCACSSSEISAYLQTL